MGGSQAWSSQVVIANKVIIQGEDDFLLVYDGQPALGNLIASIAAMAGTDDLGNSYMQGITAYSPDGISGTPINHAQLQDGTLSIGPGVDFFNSAAFFVNGADDFSDVQNSPVSTTGTHTTPTSIIKSAAIPGAATGSAGAGTVQLVDFNETAAVDQLLSGNVIHTEPDGTPDTWHVVGAAGSAAFQPLWSTSTTMGTLSPVQALRYRKDANDNVVIEGCWIAGTTPATAVFTLPPGYRPKTGHSVTITKNAAGVVTTAKGYVSGPAGNLNLNAQLGTSVTAGATYMIDETFIPLDNVA